MRTLYPWICGGHPAIVLSAATAILSLLTFTAQAAIPEGHTLVAISPGHRFGVTAPDATHGREENGNSIVEISDGTVVYQIQGITGYLHMNHGGLHGAWTKDERCLLWTIGGKWFPRAIFLIQLADGAEEAKQINLLAACQKEMLDRTLAAFPKEYKKTKEAGGYGVVFPDGFTITFDYNNSSPLTFPLIIQLELTNDPKGTAGQMPARDLKARLLTGSLTAKVNSDFKIEYSDFEIFGPEESFRRRQAGAGK